MNVLTQPVLKLNRLWQAIDETTAETAFLDLCRGAMMAVETTDMRAVGWEEWIKLPVREGDLGIKTIRGLVRVPRIVLCVKYSGRPKTRPKLNNQGIKLRDKAICQVTGDYAPDGSVDHLNPKSRGGAKKSWKNMAWMKKELNARKGNRTLEEMGWRLIKPPQEPKEVLAFQLIPARFPEWQHFLKA